ncbi:MAG TPA: hypothetical protein VJS37_06565 [Terriglobales bacterium]|nr:hypothetical protein [Terriglobales bacterium]
MCWRNCDRRTMGMLIYDVVTGLWDSWADDGFVRDVEKVKASRSLGVFDCTIYSFPALGLSRWITLAYAEKVCIQFHSLAKAPQLRIPVSTVNDTVSYATFIGGLSKIHLGSI